MLHINISRYSSILTKSCGGTNGGIDCNSNSQIYLYERTTVNYLSPPPSLALKTLVFKRWIMAPKYQSGQFSDPEDELESQQNISSGEEEFF